MLKVISLFVETINKTEYYMVLGENNLYSFLLKISQWLVHCNNSQKNPLQLNQKACIATMKYPLFNPFIFTKLSISNFIHAIHTKQVAFNANQEINNSSRSLKSNYIKTWFWLRRCQLSINSKGNQNIHQIRQQKPVFSICIFRSNSTKARHLWQLYNSLCPHLWQDLTNHSAPLL